MRPKYVLPLRFRVNMGVMVTEVHSTFLRALELEPHHQINLEYPFFMKLFFAYSKPHQQSCWAKEKKNKVFEAIAKRERNRNEKWEEVRRRSGVQEKKIRRVRKQKKKENMLKETEEKEEVDNQKETKKKQNERKYFEGEGRRRRKRKPADGRRQRLSENRWRKRKGTVGKKVKKKKEFG